MKNLTNELEEILKLSYEETLQNIVKFINSLDLTFRLLPQWRFKSTNVQFKTQSI